MPDTCDNDQLPSVSESFTRPYEDLKELKAAADAVSSAKGLSVIPDGRQHIERQVMLP